MGRAVLLVWRTQPLHHALFHMGKSHPITDSLKVIHFSKKPCGESEFISFHTVIHITSSDPALSKFLSLSRVNWRWSSRQNYQAIALQLKILLQTLQDPFNINTTDGSCTNGTPSPVHHPIQLHINNLHQNDLALLVTITPNTFSFWVYPGYSSIAHKFYWQKNT